jgi:hypothetical protein
VAIWHWHWHAIILMLWHLWGRHHLTQKHQSHVTRSLGKRVPKLNLKFTKF